MYFGPVLIPNSMDFRILLSLQIVGIVHVVAHKQRIIVQNLTDFSQQPECLQICQ